MNTNVIPFGIERKQEPKYTVNVHGRIVNRSTGTVIPNDEPVMIFRAQDKRAVPALWAYCRACTDPAHQEVIKARIAEFERFEAEHPERMKEPDSNPQELATAGVAGTPATPGGANPPVEGQNAAAA